MRVKLEYGTTGLEVELPDDRITRTLVYKRAPSARSGRSRWPNALARPAGSPPLADLARGRRSAVS